MENQWFHKIFSVDDAGFQDLALEIFRYQHEHNPVYRAYSEAIKIDPQKVSTISQIPFLPINFFKTHAIKSFDHDAGETFKSSGTTLSVKSRHLVKDPELYRQSFLRTFELFYGSPGEWCFLGLLPSYLEAKDSSLVYMMNELVKQSGHEESGFFLYDHEKLHAAIKRLEKTGQKTLLVGVSYALLDFADQFPIALEHTVVMETGGMKGRKVEITRTELHEILKKKFQVSNIHSEYGMTELLSQAYSARNGIFNSPPWMKILIRDENDPFSIYPDIINYPLSIINPVSGALNIIDFANIYSCSFIATDDAGRLHPNESFEVLGRLDNSDMRGCSLLAIGGIK